MRMGRKWTEEQRKARSIMFATDPLCPRCGEREPTAFYTHKKNGRRSNAHCAKCHKQQCRNKYNAKSMLQKRADKAVSYGLTPQQYIDMYEKQCGKCAICNEIPKTQRGLHVDHCHETGVVRGLLCHGCNVGIGNFLHSTELMNKAVKYLGG
jgi:hypothetical protein